MRRVTVSIPYNRYPESAQHILDVLTQRIATGEGVIFTVDRPNASKRRRLALRGTKARSDFDRDEFPMAIFAEGGLCSDIRYINPSDNRGCGSYISNQLRRKKVDNGDKVLFLIY